MGITMKHVSAAFDITKSVIDDFRQVKEPKAPFIVDQTRQVARMLFGSSRDGEAIIDTVSALLIEHYHATKHGEKT